MRFWMRFVLVILALTILLSLVAFTQDIATQKVDQIFSVYDKPGAPGCSLGVKRNGDFIYRKTYGSATRAKYCRNSG